MYTLGEIEAASGGQCERETLRTWAKRYVEPSPRRGTRIALASDAAHDGRHRRYTELDALRLALVCRLVRWGLSPYEAFEVVDDDQRRQIERAIHAIPEDMGSDLETRVAGRLERRRTDTFIVIQKGGDEEHPDLESLGIAGLDAVGWRFLPPSADTPCLQAALVVNLSEIARRVRDRLRTLRRIRGDDTVD